MLYRINNQKEVSEIEVNLLKNSSEGQPTLEYYKDDQKERIQYTRLHENALQIQWQGKKQKVFLASGTEGTYLMVNGQSFLLQDARREKSRRKSSQQDLPSIVTPPMPAIVVKVLVKEEQEVSKGDGLIVISAMKMESTLVAPYHGIVKKIKTTVDAKVNPGDLLVEIEETKVETEEIKDES